MGKINPSLRTTWFRSLVQLAIIASAVALERRQQPTNVLDYVDPLIGTAAGGTKELTQE
jgi:hypothetical protein